MDKLRESTVGAIVANNLLVASVFDKYGIDYCCKGNRKLEEVCRIYGLDADLLEQEINSMVVRPGSSGMDYNGWPIDLLADYIEKTHHRYVQKAIPEIVKKLEKITDVHFDKHPELKKVLGHFKESAIALTNHMRKEETILFPYIRMMVSEGNASSDEISHLGSAGNPIRQMMIEHDTEGERFTTISALTNKYVVPDDGCNTYRLTMDMLKEFDNDLHRHIHLENNILFPKALKLESGNAIL
jgi:regulator of cell morphogenesis and NO signaling